MVDLVMCVWYTCGYEFEMLILNDVNVKNTCEYVCSLLFIVLKCIFHSQSFLLILSGLWWCNANPQWFTTYLSVWTGRWSAGCLVVACWCRGVEFLFFMQVSRLGLWSRIDFACCLFDFVFRSCWDILLFEIWMIHLYLVWRSIDCLWIIYYSAAMWYNMIFMHVLLWFDSKT
jgi:hypothetical protein